MKEEKDTEKWKRSRDGEEGKGRESYVFAFHRISLFRSMASLDSMHGLGIFLGMIRPSGSSLEGGMDGGTREAGIVEWECPAPR